MGTKVNCESYLPVHHSMRDQLNEDSCSSSWPLCYRDKSVTNGQYCNGYAPRTTIDLCVGNNRDALKRKMLEHEAVFKDQVYELHRLYRRQRDMMEEARRNELNRLRGSMEPSSSSSLRVSQVPSEDARKWHMAGFPLSNSPMSCTKGNGQQLCQIPYQNGSISKESEALDTRPSKVRKKLFDLQLQADECIDVEEGEKFLEVKVSEVSSYASNANLRTDLESGRKSSLINHAGSEPDCRIVASSSSPHCRNSTRLADLNEPIVIEETPGFLSHSSINGETRSIHRPDKVNAAYVGIKGETKHAHNGFLIDSVENKVNANGHLSSIYGAGPSRCTPGSSNHCLQQDKFPTSSPTRQGMYRPTNYPPGNYPNGRCREDSWRVGSHQSSDRSRDCATNSYLEPVVAYGAQGSYPFFGSCLAGSWPQPASSRTKPKSSSTQKMESSSLSQVHFGGQWQVGASSVSFQHSVGERTMVNGFDQGSTSRSKELKAHLSSSFDYRSLKSNNAACDHAVGNGFRNFSKGSQHVVSKPVLDINLNEVFTKGSVNEAALLQDPVSRNGKANHKDGQLTLPWLKPKPADTDSAPNVSSNRLCIKTETIRDLNEPISPEVALASSDGEVWMKKETVVETPNVTKILGVPVFEKGSSPNISTVATVDCPREMNNADTGRKRRIIDINLECVPEEQMPEEEESWVKVACIREYIDLNSCASECEDPSAPSYQSPAGNFTKKLEIDLEAPVVLEEDDNTSFRQDTMSEVSLQSKAEEINVEVVRNAAETMVDISSFCPQIHVQESVSHQPEASLADSLLWFADALSNDMQSALNNDSTVTDGLQNEIDEFEAMSLQLPETKKEDYMPNPFVPEIQKLEESGANALPTRARRGQSRRGRQRRDFQRDTLPGLATLSRHEVTEDIQVFTGLMRATGHYWTSGLTRRIGMKTRGARGRRRAVAEPVPAAIPNPVVTPLVQQVNNVEAGLEDRSLTGWGRTPRRPRRQRCPAGNHPPVVLT